MLADPAVTQHVYPGLTGADIFYLGLRVLRPRLCSATRSSTNSSAARSVSFYDSSPPGPFQFHMLKLPAFPCLILARLSQQVDKCVLGQTCLLDDAQ